MDVVISLESVCSDLHKLLQRNTVARNELINVLINVFPTENNDIASYRKGDVGQKTLAKWVFAHPTCIPLLRKCLEKYDKGLVERMKTKAKECGASGWKINTVAGKFFKYWGREHVAKGATHHRLSTLEHTVKCLVESFDAQRDHNAEQDNKIKNLQSRIELLEQEIQLKDAKIKTLTEENEQLKQKLQQQVETHRRDQEALLRKIEELEKDKKVPEESNYEIDDICIGSDAVEDDE